MFVLVGIREPTMQQSASYMMHDDDDAIFSFTTNVVALVVTRTRESRMRLYEKYVIMIHETQHSFTIVYVSKHGGTSW